MTINNLITVLIVLVQLKKNEHVVLVRSLEPLQGVLTLDSIAFQCISASNLQIPGTVLEV